MTRLGMHLPNRPFQSGEMERIIALGCSDYVDLDLWPDRWQRIIERQPTARIHVRGYRRDALADPSEEADWLLGLMSRYGRWVATWRTRNEPQLESPGVTPGQWCDWLCAFGEACGPAHRGQHLLYTPAPSPSVQFPTWWAATASAAATGHFDGMDVHAYGSPEEVSIVLGEARDQWARPLLCSETNFGAGRSYDLRVYAAALPVVHQVCEAHHVEALCLFIWQWANPPALPTTVDVRGTVVEGAVRELAKCLNGGDPMASSDYPAAAWRPVANHDDGRAGHQPVAICYHIAEGYLVNLFGLFNDPAKKVSAQYGVGKGGLIEEYVAERDTAWGANWNKPELRNRFIVDAYGHKVDPDLVFVHIECEGFPGEPMPEPQYQALLGLTRSIFARHSWPGSDADRFIGHYQLDSVNRAQDPGIGFPWQRLRAEISAKPIVDLSAEATRLYALSASLAQLVMDIKAKTGV
jgi:N-acetyl-anhydromuramyl-L-alanine amidase AmpD